MSVCWLRKLDAFGRFDRIGKSVLQRYRAICTRWKIAFLRAEVLSLLCFRCYVHVVMQPNWIRHSALNRSKSQAQLRAPSGVQTNAGGVGITPRRVVCVEILPIARPMRSEVHDMRSILIRCSIQVTATRDRSHDAKSTAAARGAVKASWQAKQLPSANRLQPAVRFVWRSVDVYLT